MQSFPIALAVGLGIGVPAWHATRGRASIEDIRLYAFVYTSLAMVLLFIGAFWLGLNGVTFREIATADLPEYKSRRIVYLVYLLGSCGAMYWSILAFKRLGSDPPT